RPTANICQGAIANVSRRGLCHSWHSSRESKSDGPRPNNSFKPNLLRYTNNMAGKACNVVASATQVGLTQALGHMDSSDRVSLEDLAEVRQVVTAMRRRSLVAAAVGGLIFSALAVAAWLWL